MIELNKILCPVDFSEATPFAVRPAVSLANEYGAELILVHVLNYPYPYTDALGPSFDVQLYYDEMEEEALRRLEGLVDEDDRRFSGFRKVILRGTPHREIVELAREEDVDMVVLPTHGRTGLDRWLFGSVAEKVVRLAPCPVLTVTPRQEEPEPFMMDRVVVATDFSDYSDRAVPYAYDLARRYDATLVMVHVVTLWDYDPANPDWRFPALSEEHREAMESAAEQEMERIVEQVGADEVEVERRLVRGFDPAVEIDKLADEVDHSVIVMATHGRTGWQHAILGSTAEKVVRYSSSPVLTIKPAEAES